MDVFTVHTGTAVPLRRSNVGTDQIIPAAFLKRVTRTGFADALFAAWREDPGFVLNQPDYAGASILVAGPDFGTGSSREHAVWALQDAGFRVVVSSSFADIFRSNALRGGLVTVQLPQAVVERLWQEIEDEPDTSITVDVERRELRSSRIGASFDIDDYTRWRLMNGLDDIALTLRAHDDIAAYERQRVPHLPTTTSTVERPDD